MNFADCFPQYADPEGCWYGILREAGVPQECLAQNVPCPWCGGRDRFSFGDKGKGVFYCRQCKAQGNGYTLLGKWLGIPDFVDQSRRAQEILKSIPADTLARARSIHRQRAGGASEKQLAERHEMWERSVAISANDIVGRYLMGRVGFVPDAPDALRKLPDRYTTWMLARVTHPSSWGTVHYTDMNPDALPRRRTHEGPRGEDYLVMRRNFGRQGGLAKAEGAKVVPMRRREDEAS